jgi:protease-4
MTRHTRPALGLALVATTAMLLLAAPATAQTTLLRLWLNGPISEAPPAGAELMTLLGGEKPRTLHGLVKQIQTAAASDKIAGIVLIVDSPELGLAQIEEVHRALVAFRATGKPIHAYLDYADNRSYLLATAASDITLADNSMLDLYGLRAEMTFYKGLLDKVGVEADMMHCGAFKSAVEPYTRTEPSEAAAKQMNWLLDGLYEQFVGLIATSRGLTPEAVRAAIDSAPLAAATALEHKLVDRIAGFPEFRATLQSQYGADVQVVKSLDAKQTPDVDMSNPFAIFSLFDQLMKKTKGTPKPGVGVVYVEGGIVTGKNPGGLFGGQMAGSTTVRAALQAAMADENVAAVVVRVDSPGGSALASDIMWDAATRLGRSKPLIVSMGNVAGSGGYYVAVPGDTIFAEATTITGSIGVLGGKIIWKGLMEDKLGITSTEFTRGQRAGMLSPNRTFNEDERARMRQYLDETYAQFKGRVVASRGDRLKGDIEELAGGRVYTGTQALELGLVDQLGGLGEAIAYAAERASLAEYEVYFFPKEKDFAAILRSLMGQETEDEFEVTTSAVLRHDPLIRTLWPVAQELLGERAGAVLRDLANLQIIERERVGAFMPFSGIVR